MSGFFRRQLTDYVEYHRDWWNCAMHVFGIVFLFLAAVLPLTFWPVSVFGIQTTAAVIMALPVLIYWLLLDAAIGLGIVAAAALLLSAATLIVGHASAGAVWSITAVLIVIGIGLQVVGHNVFERRAPALLDNPSHLLLGPMFVMAKLFIALGFRHDLAVVLQPASQLTAGGASPTPEKRQGEPRPNS